MPQDAGKVIIIYDLLTLIFPIGPRSDHCLTLLSVCQSLPFCETKPNCFDKIQKIVEVSATAVDSW